MKLASNTGMLLLGIWLVLTGLIPLLKLDFQALPMLMSVLAVAAQVRFVPLAAEPYWTISAVVELATGWVANAVPTASVCPLK